MQSSLRLAPAHSSILSGLFRDLYGSSLQPVWGLVIQWGVHQCTRLLLLRPVLSDNVIGQLPVRWYDISGGYVAVKWFQGLFWGMFFALKRGFARMFTSLMKCPSTRRGRSLWTYKYCFPTESKNMKLIMTDLEISSLQMIFSCIACSHSLPRWFLIKQSPLPIMFSYLCLVYNICNWLNIKSIKL